MNRDSLSTAPRAVRIAIARALVDLLTGGAGKRRAAGGVTAASGGEYGGSRKGEEVNVSAGHYAATCADRARRGLGLALSASSARRVRSSTASAPVSNREMVA